MAAKERKSVLLRLDPDVHEALSRWAADELRSANAQIEFLLRRALGQAGRLPRGVRADVTSLPRRGRPPKGADGADEPDAAEEPDTERGEPEAGDPRPDPHEENP